MSYARSKPAPARHLLAACLVLLPASAAFALESTLQDALLQHPPAAQDKGLGLKLTLKPSDFPVFSHLAPAPVLDLTLRWENLSTPLGPVSLFAGRSLGRQPVATPGLAPPDPEVRSASDLMFIGVQFEGGARLRLKRSGDGLKLSYRTSF